MKFLLWLLCRISQGILSVTPSVMFSGHRVVRELTVGRRIGFYKIRGEIGCGNFSHVKLGIHALTKGRKLMKSLKLLKHTHALESREKISGGVANILTVKISAE